MFMLDYKDKTVETKFFADLKAETAMHNMTTIPEIEQLLRRNAIVRLRFRPQKLWIQQATKKFGISLILEQVYFVELPKSTFNTNLLEQNVFDNNDAEQASDHEPKPAPKLEAPKSIPKSKPKPETKSEPEPKQPSKKVVKQVKQDDSDISSQTSESSANLSSESEKPVKKQTKKK
jgi:hypothetical protein